MAQIIDLLKNTSFEDKMDLLIKAILKGENWDYAQLDNKPSINGNTLEGNKTNAQLGIPTKTSDLTNDSWFVSDKNYVHTDNNYTDLDKISVSLVKDKVDKIDGKGLSTNDLTDELKADYDDAVLQAHTHSNKTILDNTTASYTTEEKTKLSGIENNAQKNTVIGVKGEVETDYRVGNVNITKKNIGLGNVANERQWSATNHPTTMSGYGITDGASITDYNTLKGRVDTNEDNIAMLDSDVEGLTTDVGTLKTDMTTVKGAVTTIQGNYVPKTRKVNGKALSADITLGASDVKAIPTSQKGTANGVAELDANGLVPSSQLPSYVDDVLEYDTKTDFPTNGESGKIYIATDTNLQYRWTGTQYVEISSSLALGETSSTAYRGDRGKIAYDHSQKTSGNPHKVTKGDVGLSNVPNVTTNDQTPTFTESTTLTKLTSGEKLSVAFGKISKAITDLINHIANKNNPHKVTKTQVGLGSVGNFKAVSTVASQGLTDTEKANARTNIGAGTSNFSGAYADLTGRPTLGTAASKTVRTLSDVGDSGWKDLSTDQDYVPDMAFMTFWNGAYSSNGASNLVYCNRGAFGTIVTKNAGDYATAGHTHNYAGSSSAGGAANSANKLTTSRTVSGGVDIPISFTYDGSVNSSASIGYYSCFSTNSNTNNYPFHRIAYTGEITSAYNDKSMTLYISQGYQNGGFGIVRITIRTNNTGIVSTAEAKWLVRSGFEADTIQIALYNVFGKTYADVFFKSNGRYSGCVFRAIASDVRGHIARTFTLVNSFEVADTTTSDKKTSKEVYTSIASAASSLHNNQAYTDILGAIDSGTTSYANSAGTAINATKLQTYKRGSTTETYGNSYPIYAQWEDSSNVKLKCDNYTVKTDYANTSGNSSKVNNHTVNSDVPANAKFTDTTYSDATTSSNGLMTADMVKKLNGIEEGANKYSLPTASANTLGGVKVGSSLKIVNGVLNLVWQ
jgi:hypothetical protein